MGRTAVLRGLILGCLIAVGAWGLAPAAGGVTGHPRATGPAARSDFNGDGIPDLAIGEPFAMVGANAQDGEVHVLYGSAAGPVAAGSQAFVQTDLDPSAQTADVQWFGRLLATGDFNRDGFADLAIGAPADTAGGVGEAGKVFVMFGSPTGLRAAGSREFDKSTPGLQGDPGVFDQLPEGLLAADLDGDGFSDLVIGDPNGTVGGVDQAGDVYVLFGSGSGPTTTGHEYLTKGAVPSGIGGTLGDADRLGWSLAAANFNGDAHRDLVIGAPGESVGGAADAGATYVITGTDGGPDPAAGVQRITEDTPGVGTQAKASEFFGFGLLAANLGRGSRADLVITVENEVVQGQEEAGALAVLYATSGGLTGQGSQFFTQASPGFPGNPTGEVGLGEAMDAGNVGGSKAIDLVLGLDGFGPTRAGAVVVLFGGPNGISTNGAQAITQNAAGIAGDPEQSGEFGSAVAVRKYGNGAPADVAVGADRRTVAGHAAAGGTYVLFGSANGPTGSGSLSFTENTQGIPGGPSDEELFGAFLA